MEPVLPCLFKFVLLCSDVIVDISESNIVMLWNMLSQELLREYSTVEQNHLKTLKFLVNACKTLVLQ